MAKKRMLKKYGYVIADDNGEGVDFYRTWAAAKKAAIALCNNSVVGTKVLVARIVNVATAQAHICPVKWDKKFESKHG